MAFSDPLLEVNENSLKEYLSMVTSLNLKVRFPGIVMSYDREKNMAVVKIAIKFCNSSKEFSEYPTLEVPVHRYGGGGYHISCDLQEGDSGDIVFYDRDMTKFWDTLVLSETVTTRSHSLEDAEFFPIDRKVKETEAKGLLLTKDDNTILINLTEDTALIQNNTTTIEMKADTINMKTNTTSIESPTVQVQSNSMDIQAPQMAITSQNMAITSPLGSFSGVLTAGELHALNGASGTAAGGTPVTFVQGVCVKIG